jgi:two-component system response regulator BasR
MKILIIEDDALLVTGLTKALEQDQYRCDVAQSLRTSRQYDVDEYELVILDLGLPDGDGLSLLKDWRRKGLNVPVLILTARDTLADKVGGLDLGADDYLVKPFALAELMARVRALMRRRFEKAENWVNAGEFKIDMTHHQVFQNDSELMLTRMEYAIFRRLMLHVGKTVNRDRLQQDLYDWQDDIGSNTLEVYIHHLRKKIGTELIKTIRGEGYRLEIPN